MGLAQYGCARGWIEYSHDHRFFPQI